MIPDTELESQLSELIALRLPEWQGNEALSQSLVLELNQEENDEGRLLLVKSRGFAIRNDDLAFIDSILTGVKAGSAIMLFKPDVAAVVAFIATLAKLGRNVLNKSADLNAKSIAVLTILKENPNGLLVREVAELLNVTNLSSRFTLENMQQMLEDLGNIRLRDGSVSKFAVVDSQGMWSANGL